MDDAHASEPRFPEPKGNPPTIEWSPVDALMVDAEYQRSTANGSSSRLISAIAGNWDWRLCVPLLVSRRESRLYVIDGQHRLAAARMRGDIRHLPCCISAYDSSAEEARLFVQANRVRRSMSRFDDHRAALAAGDAVALEVEGVVRDAGLSIAETTAVKAWRPGELGCIAGVRTALRRHGRPVVSSALVNLAEAFPDEQMLYAGTILGALYEILSKPPADLDPDRLLLALLTKTQKAWIDGLAEKPAAGSSSVHELRVHILEAYARLPPE